MGLGLMKIKLLTHYRLKTEEIFLLLENPPQAFDVSGVSEYTVGSIMVRNRIFYISLNIFIVEKAHYSQTIQLHKVIGLERKLVAYIVLLLIMNKLCTIRQK